LSIGISILTDKEQTATESAINAAGETSDLSSMASSLASSLNMAYSYWCDMMGKKATGFISVNKDFTGMALTPAQAKIYLDMYNSGTLTLEQFWDEMELREVIQTIEDRDLIKAELEATNQNVSIG